MEKQNHQECYFYNCVPATITANLVVDVTSPLAIHYMSLDLGQHVLKQGVQDSERQCEHFAQATFSSSGTNQCVHLQ